MAATDSGASPNATREIATYAINNGRAEWKRRRVRDWRKASLPVLSHHHTYFSFADSIMPQFFLAVGFAYRLTFLRRREQLGAGPALHSG